MTRIIHTIDQSFLSGYIVPKLTSKEVKVNRARAKAIKDIKEIIAQRG